jgi:hypothetical protein
VAVLLVGLIPGLVRASTSGSRPSDELPDPGSGGYSVTVALVLGVAISTFPPERLDQDVGGAPGILGLYGAVRFPCWLEMRVSGVYEFDIHRWLLLAGPYGHVSVGNWSFGAGIEAGIEAFDSRWMLMFGSARLAFTLSPQAYVELAVARHFIIGLAYAYDLPFGNATVAGHRVMITEGWRF